jgi:nitroreductase
MKFQELAERRYSCRSYMDAPVEREKLVACVEAARMSPSACNSQPWGFVVVDDKALAKEVSECLRDKVLPINGFTRNCNAFIIVVEESANLSSKLGGKFKDQEFAQMDIGITALSVCLNASDLGLGTCIIGWFDEKRLTKMFSIPSGKRIRLIISIGYPTDDAARPKVRKPLEEKIHFNGW